MLKLAKIASIRKKIKPKLLARLTSHKKTEIKEKIVNRITPVINLSASSRQLILVSSLIGICAALITVFNKIKHRKSLAVKDAEKEAPGFKSYQEDDFSTKLVNKPPIYINLPPVESLISFPRYEKVLLQIKLARSNPSRINNQSVLHELAKLSDCDEDIDPLGHNALQANLEDLIKVKLLRQHKKQKSIRQKSNSFLNDVSAQSISQYLSNDLMIQLALIYPYIDNRFFRTEPPTTIEKIRKLKNTDDNEGDLSEQKDFTNVYDDPAYSLLFEFHHKFISNFKQNAKKGKNDKQNEMFYTNKNLNEFIRRLDSDVNALLVSGLIKDMYKLSEWSSIDIEELLGQERTYKENDSDSSRHTTLKERMKFEIVERYEIFLMKIIDKMARLDIVEFVNLGGMELLLLFYEKHKNDEAYMITIGNCLCLASLHSQFKALFIQSGWLKRLNEMCKNTGPNPQTNLTKELIAHKILFNLSQDNHSSTRLVYGDMVYPLYPLYSQGINLAQNLIDHDKSNIDQHQHVIDVVFIHGLGGSIFKTWRKNEKPNKDKEATISATKRAQQITKIDNTDEANILFKINSLIETHLNKYTFCWPRDWLAYDLVNELKNSQNFTESQLEDNNFFSDMLDIDKFRIMGINYETMYSLWGEELIDDKKLKLSIKQRAIDLVKELEMAHINTNRPIVFVCHSMGGLIIKQMLVHLDEIKSQLLDNTKAIVFLSTPHLGSNLASKAKNLSFALFPSTDLIELSSKNTYLVDLNKKFLNLMKSKLKDKLQIISMCENLPTWIGVTIPRSQIVVDKESADIGVGEFCFVENKNHLDICKPDDKNCVIYSRVKSVIYNLIEEENLKCEKCKLDAMAERNRKMGDYLFEFLKLNYFF